MEIATIGLWGGFIAGLGVLLCLDIFVVHRKAHVVGVREALIWTGVWIGLALTFAAGVFIFDGSDSGGQFLAGYVIEKSLSVDNIFVFLVIFQYFAVPPVLQPKVLHWGVIGALVMRLMFILLGAALLKTFHWMIFVFGGILIVTALRLAFQSEHEVHPEKNPVLRLLSRILPISKDYAGDRLFVRQAGVLSATPLLAVLVVVESTDLIFAVDSVPAIFAITDDPFIVFTSNAFAILGLRALYFALAGIVGYFTYLRQGLVGVLAFVGTKMIVSDLYHFPTFASLGVIGGILGLAVVASLLFRKPLEEVDDIEDPGHMIAHEPLMIEHEHDRERQAEPRTTIGATPASDD